MPQRLLVLLLAVSMFSPAFADFTVTQTKYSNSYDRNNFWAKQPKPRLEVFLRATVDINTPQEANRSDHLYALAVKYVTESLLEAQIPEEVTKEWIMVLIVECTPDHTNESMHPQWLLKRNPNKLQNLPALAIDFSKTPNDFAYDMVGIVLFWLNSEH